MNSLQVRHLKPILHNTRAHVLQSSTSQERKCQSCACVGNRRQYRTITFDKKEHGAMVVTRAEGEKMGRKSTHDFEPWMALIKQALVDTDGLFELQSILQVLCKSPHK